MKADNDTMNTRKELKKHIDALYNFVNNDDGDYSAIKSTIEILSAKHNDYTEKDVIGNTTSISRFLSYITKDLQILHSAV